MGGYSHINSPHRFCILFIKSKIRSSFLYNILPLDINISQQLYIFIADLYFKYKLILLDCPFKTPTPVSSTTSNWFSDFIKRFTSIKYSETFNVKQKKLTFLLNTFYNKDVVETTLINCVVSTSLAILLNLLFWLI